MERATRSVFIQRASLLMKVSGPRRAYLIGTIDLFDPPTPLRPSRSLKRLRKSVWKESRELAQRRVALLAPGTVAAPLRRLVLESPHAAAMQRRHLSFYF